MPLKHFTETFLVVVLGAVIALTGLLAATLPDLPEGALPWGVLFVLSVIYPLCLHSLFHRRRADNFFRNLHWFPAFILLLWAAMQGIAASNEGGYKVLEMFRWGWTLPAVIVGFVSVVLFCLKVIRRRVPRIVLLALILVPFTAAALYSEKSGHWEEELASVLWGNEVWSTDASGLLAVFDLKDDEESEDEEHERSWREKLAMRKQRDHDIENGGGGVGEITGGDEDTSMKEAHERAEAKRQETAKLMAEKKPDMLTESGFGWSAIILTLVAMYCAALHDRSRKIFRL